MPILMRRVSLLLGLALTTSSFAQDFDLTALKWRNIGPNRGGRSQTVAGSTHRPFEYYFGATGGGLWKTSDGGTAWVPVTDGQIGSSSVGAVAVSESNPDIVYIGMGETELRGSIMQGDGVYKSIDAGKTWKHLGLADTQAISRIRIDPTNPDNVYVAALGHPYGPNPDRGIFRSTDGGLHWKKVLFRNEQAGAADLTLDPHHPQVMFASLWEVRRSPWTLSSGGASSGLFKSVDGGETWEDITRAPGLPSGVLGKITLAISPADSKRVYAMVESAAGGLFQSNDAGATWKLVNEDHNIRQRAFYFSRITADPQHRDTLWIMNVEIYRSDDGGKTLQLQRTAHGDHHDLWIAPNDSRRMAAADDGGGCVSVDGGKTWTRENFPTAQLYHVATTAEFPYDVVGAQQDDGTAAVPSDKGTFRREPSWPTGEWMYPTGGGEAGYVAPDLKNPDIFYGGDQAGDITRYNRRTGATRSVTVYPLFFSGMSAGVLKDRWQWTFPIVISPVDGTIYTSSQRLFKSTSQGQHWDAISEDLTRSDPETLGDSGGPITKDQNGPEIYGTIFSIAPSRHEAATLWTGSDDGLVYLTRDGGHHWTNVTPPQMERYSRISLIEASPHNPAGAYVASKRYQMDDRAPYLYRTHDYGKTWTPIVTGIPDGDYLQAVREDPSRAGLLYAGTEHGIYVSFDDGDHWRSLSLNLPNTQVADLVVEKNDLVIATHGRSFWILDDIAPLRQYTPAVLQSSVHLFEPPPVTRSVTPARIDYYLAQAAPKLTLEILDAHGEIIRTLQSGEIKTLETHAGLNRYVWDLRYPGAVTFPGVVLRGAAPGQGPKAPPGAYSVRLTAGGTTITQPFVVRRDARLTEVTDADVAEQFALAMKVRDELGLAHATVIKIRSLKKQLLDRAQDAADDSSIASAAAALTAQLTVIEEQLYQTKNRSPRDTFNYPIKLNNQLAVLQTQVDTGDNKPTDQDYAVNDELKAHLDQILAKFDALLANELPAFNQALGPHHLELVKIPEGISLTTKGEAGPADSGDDDDDDDDV